MDSNRITSSHCRTCNMELDAATGITTIWEPKAGDLSVCAYCGQISVFDDDMQLVAPARELYDEVAAMPQVAAIRRAIKARAS